MLSASAACAVVVDDKAGGGQLADKSVDVF
jgi:hypothetical protein